MSMEGITTEDHVEGQDECLSKSFTQVFNSDSLVFKGRCKFHCIFATSIAGKGEIHLYAGIDANARKLTTLFVQAEASCCFQPRYPQVCESGLYVEVERDTIYVTIEFEPLSKKATY